MITTKQALIVSVIDVTTEEIALKRLEDQLRYVRSDWKGKKFKVWITVEEVTNE